LWKAWLARYQGLRQATRRDTPEIVNRKIDEHFDAVKKDLQGQKRRQLTDPSTWFCGGELTPEADTELKGLDKRRQDAKKAAKVLELGQFNTATEARHAAEREQRLAMQEQLVGSTVGRVEALGLLPEQSAQAQATQQPAKTGKSGPIGPEEQMLPPKPSAVVQVPETLQGVQIPKNPDTKQWDQEDRQAWAQLSPQQKKDLVANRGQAQQISQAEAQKAARPQAWCQNCLNSLGRGAAPEGLLMGMQGAYRL
jgi:hypothetical protein